MLHDLRLCEFRYIYDVTMTFLYEKCFYLYTGNSLKYRGHSRLPIAHPDLPSFFHSLPSTSKSFLSFVYLIVCFTFMTLTREARKPIYPLMHILKQGFWYLSHSIDIVEKFWSLV